MLLRATLGRTRGIGQAMAMDDNVHAMDSLESERFYRATELSAPLVSELTVSQKR